MPAERTKSRKGKAPQRAQDGQEKIPGVQKIKSSLRQARRLLLKDKITADVRNNTERRIKALEEELEKAELARKERTLAAKYHKVKFFERQKALRKVQQLKRELAHKPEDEDLQSRLFERRVDLNYVLHYPKLKKYISLYPPQKSDDAAPQPPVDTSETDAARAELRDSVRQRMQAGELPAEPEVDIDSRPRVTEKRDASKTAPSKSKVAKGKTASAQPSFQTAAEDEFFGNDSDGEDDDDDEEDED
uniref:rRNA-processing protein EFG1 n=1 Tax=Schizophyllum commune (strain H4-8 / FGSC 9210) TaxID=578458 RepID=D8QAC0_SCHCM